MGVGPFGTSASEVVMRGEKEVFGQFACHNDSGCGCMKSF